MATVGERRLSSHDNHQEVCRMANVAQWKIDPSHTLVEFAVRHLMISTVKGRFAEVEGTITADPDDLSSASAEVEIGAASIDTRDQQRDDHLRSADFFDAEKFPKLVFKSRKMTPKGGDKYELEGDLTIRDVTRPITLDVTFEGRAKDPWGNERIGFSATGELDRRDYGLTWNAALETGGVLVGEKVRIHLEVEAIRQG